MFLVRLCEYNDRRMETKKSRQVWLAVAAVAVLVLLIIGGSKALALTSFKSGDSATVTKNETVDGSLWSAAKNVDISGTVNGDLFCIGESVYISGTISGDVICAGKTINISGTIGGNLRLAAQTVNFSGSSGRSATMAGETLNIERQGSIGNDASLGATSVNVLGKIGRDLAATGTSLNISGQVGRDISSNAARINLLQGASVAGRIDYTSSNKISMAGGTQVGGQITQRQPKAGKSRPASLLFFGGFAVPILIMLLVTAMSVFALFPRLVASVTNQGKKRPWASLAVGILSSMAVPIIIFMLAITVVAIPLAILALLAWLLVNLSSGIFSAFWLGRIIWRHYNNVLLIGLAGSLLLLLLYLIPVVGLITLILAVWFGQGMILLELYSRFRRPDYKLNQPPAAKRA